MIKEFSKNYVAAFVKDKAKAFIFNVVLIALIYIIFDPIWWQMLIISVVYIAIRVLWAFVFKRYIQLFGLYKSAKDVYEAIPDESKSKAKSKLKTIATNAHSKAKSKIKVL